MGKAKQNVEDISIKLLSSAHLLYDTAAQVGTHDSKGTSLKPLDSRSLIRLYRESEWRSTRLQVLRELSSDEHSDQRVILFLIDLVLENQDLAEQRLALFALGQKKQAAKFIRNFYKHCPDSLKADVAYALGLLQDERSSLSLLSDLSVAQKKQDLLWLKNIVLALGELKVFAALPELRTLLESLTLKDRDLVSAVLFSLGKLDRDPRFLQLYRKAFLRDSLLFQVYQNSLSQIQVRSQFKIEDYLNKMLHQERPHPALPLELASFSHTEIEAAIGLIDLHKTPKVFLMALKGLSLEQRRKWIQNEKEFQSLQHLQDVPTFLGVEDWLMQIKPEHPEGALIWLKAAFELSEDSAWASQAFAELAPQFLKKNVTSMLNAMEFINLWSPWAMLEEASVVLKQIELWFALGMSDEVKARVFRTLSELGTSKKFNVVFAPWIEQQWSGKNGYEWMSDFAVSTLRTSLLMLLEQFPHAKALEKILAQWPPLQDHEKKALLPRILSVMESFSGEFWDDKFMKSVYQASPATLSVESKLALLKLLRHSKKVDKKEQTKWESFVLTQAQNLPEIDFSLQLQAIIALKAFTDSPEASTALSAYLLPHLLQKSTRPVPDRLRGRALDSLCAHSSLVAKRAVFDYLAHHIYDEEVVDKIYRCFDPQQKGGQEFIERIEQILAEYPDLDSWEKLVQLKDRLSLSHAAQEQATQGVALLGQKSVKNIKTATGSDLDPELLKLIPQFKKLDHVTQSVLRAAEHHFMDESTALVDKAPIVLEYCKALDLVLEKNLGQKHLFNKLETSLHAFQTLWHRVGFSDDYPSLDKVSTALGLKGQIAADYFPLHKMKLMAQSFFNGKILQDRLRVFDGLRAWAVIFLVFCRKLPAAGAVGSGGGQSSSPPLIPLESLTDAQCVQMAKKLMVLQDVRNPAAHRQTYTNMDSIKNMRAEAIELINFALKI